MALISVLQEQAAEIASGQAASRQQIRKFKLLLSSCVAPLQPSQPGARSSPRALAEPLLAPLAVGLEEGELLHEHFQTPTSITAPPFSQVLFFAR